MLKKCVMLAALALVLAPGSARADWLFTPNIGTGFGGDASGREHRFEIVGTYEVDILKGKVSDQSPIGQALAGKREGDTVNVQMPRGKQDFKILEVIYDA